MYVILSLLLVCKFQEGRCSLSSVQSVSQEKLIDFQLSVSHSPHLEFSDKHPTESTYLLGICRPGVNSELHTFYIIRKLHFAQ